MNKTILFVVLLAFALEMGCQNGHKSQPWHTPSPKQNKARKK